MCDITLLQPAISIADRIILGLRSSLFDQGGRVACLFRRLRRHTIATDNSATPEDFKRRLIWRLERRSAVVAVIGLGYVGLPLAIALWRAGYRVVGVDVSSDKVTAINEGDPFIDEVDADELRAALRSGAFTASEDFASIGACDAVSICVPTPLRKTEDPDISYIVAATEAVAKCLRVGSLVVLESTTYPGTTREIIAPILEGTEQRLVVGQSVFLAFSPERIDPGRTDWDVVTTPKVVGGVTANCLEAALAYYAPAIRNLVPVSSPEAAEMVKLLENTFRAVNIGLANEMLLMCDKLGLDAWEVTEAAATKPFGFMRFTPGPGLGGHCIPIDPLYLSWRLKTLNYSARFIDLASEINTSMPRYWVQRVQDTLNNAGKAVKGSQILLLGMAYKKDVSDTRESPALDIARLLAQKGAHVLWHDPHVDRVDDLDGLAIQATDVNVALAASDCVVVVTDHDAYDFEAIGQRARLLVDTRHVVNKRPVPSTAPVALIRNRA